MAICWGAPTTGTVVGLARLVTVHCIERWFWQLAASYCPFILALRISLEAIYPYSGRLNSPTPKLAAKRSTNFLQIQFTLDSLQIHFRFKWFDEYLLTWII
ncbi:hypothetical protein ACN38_g7920 [Penicillium nordicum]|uniref:Uncharacterized protein n=1 Tax=Penicillium nordicum TaxID=229535 RepID=A0A0M9WDY7_9EURO|nr:hypothetical protein ACN38_g7920 [Penicillium nordicum]